MPGAEIERRRRRESLTSKDRRGFVLSALERPRTQSELRDALGMSNSGIRCLLRRLERDGLARPTERVGGMQIWETTRGGD